MKTPEQIAEIKQDLLAKGVEYCMGAYVDIHGVPKGKVVPIAHLDHMAQGSERYTGYALDGLGQSPHEDELTSVPDLDHIIQLPWEPKIAWMPADNHFQGEPYALSTRVALQNVIKQANEMGFGFNLGIECEIYLLKRDEQGQLSVPERDNRLNKPCYDLQGFVDQFGWLDEVSSTINNLGWDLYSLDHEDGNSQYEFDFNYADALTTCDRFIFFRFMAKHYAKQRGMIATMMPKPFADKTGTGAHFNMSLSDLQSGANVFKRDASSADDPWGLGLSDTGYYFIGGLLKHGRALCAAFAPTVNSYKRLVRQGAMSYFSWAPVFNSWGSNNRTNAVRVPAGGGRCESRNADGAVNPYLAATLALAAGLEGIREKIDPRQPNEDNLYAISEAERRERGIDFLPQNLLEAVEAFDADPFVAATLGEALKKEFIHYKLQEWNSYHLHVSQWETDRYSTIF